MFNQVFSYHSKKHCCLEPKFEQIFLPVIIFQNVWGFSSKNAIFANLGQLTRDTLCAINA